MLLITKCSPASTTPGRTGRYDGGEAEGRRVRQAGSGEGKEGNEERGRKTEIKEEGTQE